MILITGAGGTCGRELIRVMIDAGIPFRAGYSTAVKASMARDRGFDAVVADFRHPASLRPALRGIDAVFLLCGWSPDQSLLEASLVREAARAGVRHVVKMSVWDAGGEAFSFARIHRPVEREIEESGMAWTFLRPNGFMQNLSNFLSATVRSQSALFAPAAEALVSHVDVRDVARVAAAALTRPGHRGNTYELSGPEALTYRQMAATLSDLLARTVTCVELTPDQARAGIVAGGAPAAYAEAVIDLTRYYSGGNASSVSPDVKRVTGAEPASFDRFAKDHIAAFQPAGQDPES